MNILYLIGNGFDLNLGLRTSYRQFYEYYLGCKTFSTAVAKLKSFIKEDGKTELWSDLEWALGQYSIWFEDANEFQTALFDISDKLREYIQRENGQLIVTEQATQRFCADLTDPVQYLRPATAQTMRSYQANWVNYNSWNIDIITFNYTSSIERLLQKGTKKLGQNTHGRPVMFSGIHHVHGFWNETILLGVNDAEQIANKTFRKQEELTDIFVKPQANAAEEILIDSQCTKLINNANLICTFGLSFGKTDNIWWERIRRNLTRKDCKLLLFDYIEELNLQNNRMMLLQSYKREAQKRFAGDQYENLKNKIEYGLNTDMFNLRKYVSRAPQQAVLSA